MKLIIEVRGGNVADCYSDSKELEVILVDWDNIEGGDFAGEIVPTPMSEIPQDTSYQLKRIQN